LNNKHLATAFEERHLRADGPMLELSVPDVDLRNYPIHLICATVVYPRYLGEQRVVRSYQSTHAGTF